MRELVSFDDSAEAKSIGNVLRGQGIETLVNQGRDSSWRVWVLDEGDLEMAKLTLAEYKDNPNDSHWIKLATSGRHQRDQQQRAELAAKRMDEAAKIQASQLSRWSAGRFLSNIGRVTLGLMVLSIGFALISQFGKNTSIVSHLTIASFRVSGKMVYWYNLDDIKNGELWRLFTPMLLHFSIFHLAFNMLWLKELGSLIERERPWWFLPVLVLVISGISNIAQYYWPPPSPNFGGMSGVVYGLLGYLWVRGKLDPRARFAVRSSTMMWMMAWLLICFTGLMGPIANGAHVAGLTVGAAWGYLGSGHLGRKLHS